MHHNQLLTIAPLAVFTRVALLECWHKDGVVTGENTGRKLEGEEDYCVCRVEPQKQTGAY
jgi:hypothetical protein